MRTAQTPDRPVQTLVIVPPKPNPTDKKGNVGVNLHYARYLDRLLNSHQASP